MLAQTFCREEIKNFELVANKMGIALRDFIYSYLPSRQYCFITLNTDISKTYIINHLNYHPSHKEQASFIRQVNKGMNNFLKELE